MAGAIYNAPVEPPPAPTGITFTTAPDSITVSFENSPTATSYTLTWSGPSELAAGSCTVQAPASSITCQVPPGDWTFTLDSNDLAGSTPAPVGAGPTLILGAVGDPCSAGSECLTGVCNSSGACGQGGAGATCDGVGDCLSGICNDGSCSQSVLGIACAATPDCLEGTCIGQICEPGPGAPGCGQNSTWTDGTGDNHNGTLAFVSQPYTGFTGSGTAADPYAVTFDGINDRVDLAVATDGLRYSDAITTEFWTRVDQYSSTNENLYVNRNNVTEYSGSWIGLNAYDNEPNHWSAGYSNDGNSWTEVWSDTPVQLGVWTHVAFTYSTTLGASLYVNGVLQQKQLAASGPIYYASDAVPRLSEATTYPYHGAIGVARVWHAALGLDEIEALYAQGAARFGLPTPQPAGSVDEPLALLLDAAQCAPAGAGTACAGPGDCSSGVCNEGLCGQGGAGTSCGVPTDCLSDACGAGNRCSQSTQGGACATGGDCATGTCISNLCAPGPVGSPCGGSIDCVTSVCSGNGTCGAAETGSGCLSDGDCVTANCNLGSGFGNGNTGNGNGNGNGNVGAGNGNGNPISGVGVCGQAAPQGPCDVASDCTSGVCTQGGVASSGGASGTCAAPSCSDGVQNEGETGIDCGGPCAQLATPKLCSAGVECNQGSDCASGSCVNQVCLAPPPAPGTPSITTAPDSVTVSFVGSPSASSYTLSWTDPSGVAPGGSCTAQAPASSITCQVPAGDWSFELSATDQAGSSTPVPASINPVAVCAAVPPLVTLSSPEVVLVAAPAQPDPSTLGVVLAGQCLQVTVSLSDAQANPFAYSGPGQLTIGSFGANDQTQLHAAVDCADAAQPSLTIPSGASTLTFALLVGSSSIPSATVGSDAANDKRHDKSDNPECLGSDCGAPHASVGIGEFSATITVGGSCGASSTVWFDLSEYAQPVVAGVNPDSGVAGTSVTITGSYFTGATAVTLHGRRGGWGGRDLHREQRHADHRGHTGWRYRRPGHRDQRRRHVYSDGCIAVHLVGRSGVAVQRRKRVRQRRVRRGRKGCYWAGPARCAPRAATAWATRVPTTAATRADWAGLATTRADCAAGYCWRGLRDWAGELRPANSCLTGLYHRARFNHRRVPRL